MNDTASTRHELVHSGPDAVRLLLERLRQHRLKRNWSQAEMARRAHLSRAAYQNFETGHGNITLRNLMKILWVLGLTHHLAHMVPPVQAGALASVPAEPTPAPSIKPARQRAYTRRPARPDTPNSSPESEI
jgi:transcriptional regulator with XRE-family HTH domain